MIKVSYWLELPEQRSILGTIGISQSNIYYYYENY